eukprot:scaffold6684_cov104-Isochrysis_galbana.AAC.2
MEGERRRRAHVSTAAIGLRLQRNFFGAVQCWLWRASQPGGQPRTCKVVSSRYRPIRVFQTSRGMPSVMASPHCSAAPRPRAEKPCLPSAAARRGVTQSVGGRPQAQTDPKEVGT